jgi:hypothetical protein
MQKKDEKQIARRQNPFSLFMLSLCSIFLLSACTTDSVPDEEFEMPTGNFPLLSSVPDRSSFGLSDDIGCQQKRLQWEHDQAMKKQVDVIESIKPW